MVNCTMKNQSEESNKLLGSYFSTKTSKYIDPRVEMGVNDNHEKC